MTEKPKQKTRAELEAVIADLTEQLALSRDAYNKHLPLLQNAMEREKQTRLQFGDLKERLANAGIENQRLRGYIDRVQEDDVVREEFVAVGDPAGEQQLVPKRKPTIFSRGSDYSSLSGCDTAGMSYSQQRDRPKPRHWVTY